MSSKRCFKCLCVKPIDAFYKHSAMKDGRLNKCITCTKKDSTNNRIENIDRIRAYDRARASLPHRSELRKQIVKRWLKQHPDRKAATTKVSTAIRSKKLIRPMFCLIPECDKKPEAHHPDYDRPLDVVWLCRAHHMQAHAISHEEEAEVF